MKQYNVITRFAPSPTGDLHIGGARTALFNWLYAKNNSGKMLLRIEDTDRFRSKQDYLQNIVSGLQWLGLNWDGNIISQFQRISRHQSIVEQLISKNKAYYYSDDSDNLNSNKNNLDKKFYLPTVRMRIPKEGDVIIDDIIQGKISFLNKNLHDFTILRSDGTPTYMLAVVVDDHDMGITHIIRGNDHLTNAAYQTIIYEAMGWKIPIMGHLPLIHGQDKVKLSKRHGSLSIKHYKSMGYLPEAICNYLVRLGWSHGNDEFFSLEEMIKLFDLKKINKGPSCFDINKLNFINSRYIRSNNPKKIIRSAIDLSIKRKNSTIGDCNKKKYIQLNKAFPSLKKRSSTLLDLIDEADFIISKRPIIIEKKCQDFLKKHGYSILYNIFPLLWECKNWNIETLNNVIQEFLKKNNLKLINVYQSLRVVLTGKSKSIGILDVLTILEKEESLKRIQDHIEM